MTRSAGKQNAGTSLGLNCKLWSSPKKMIQGQQIEMLTLKDTLWSNYIFCQKNSTFFGMKNSQNSLYLLHHTVRKVNFLSKNSILTKPQHFLEFSKFFWQFFSWNQSCQQLKSPKPQHFYEFFTPKKSTIFLGKSKLNFWTKNEDFERCGTINSFSHTYDPSNKNNNSKKG